MRILAINSTAGYQLQQKTTAQEVYARASVFYYLGRYDECLEQLQIAENSNPEPHIQNMILL